MTAFAIIWAALFTATLFLTVLHAVNTGDKDIARDRTAVAVAAVAWVFAVPVYLITFAFTSAVDWMFP